MKKMLMMCAVVAATLGAAAQEVTFEDALSEFSSDNVILWLDSPLYKKISHLKEGDCKIITAESWKGIKTVIVYSVENQSCFELSSDGAMIEISIADFKKECSRPALVANGKKVYLNIPNAKVKNDQDLCLGQLLAGDLFAITEDVVGKVPSREVRVTFVTPEGINVDLGQHVLGYRVKDADIRKAIRTKLQAQANAEWKRHHEQLVASLPKKPRVVYGSRRTVFKRMDGVFEIPYEKPPEFQEKTYYSTVYADAWGESEFGGRFCMQVPVGVREYTYTKPLTQFYDYDALKAELEAYNELREEIKNDRPREVTDEEVENAFAKGMLYFRKA